MMTCEDGAGLKCFHKQQQVITSDLKCKYKQPVSKSSQVRSSLQFVQEPREHLLCSAYMFNAFSSIVPVLYNCSNRLAAKVCAAGAQLMTSS